MLYLPGLVPPPGHTCTHSMCHRRRAPPMRVVLENIYLEILPPWYVMRHGAVSQWQRLEAQIQSANYSVPTVRLYLRLGSSDGRACMLIIFMRCLCSSN